MQRRGNDSRRSATYIVTFTTSHHAPILLEQADLMIRAIHPSELRQPFHLIAWVILPDHVHLIIDPQQQPVHDIVNNIKVTFGWFYRIRTGHRGPIWELDFTDTLISGPRELKEQIEYVHQNPVRHNLVRDSYRYPYSSLREGLIRGSISVEPAVTDEHLQAGA